MTFAEKSNRFNMPWKITEQNREVLFSMARNLMFTLKLELSALIAYLQIAVVETALKHMDGLGPWFVAVFLGSIFSPLDSFLCRARKWCVSKNSCLRPFSLVHVCCELMTLG